MHKKSKNIYSSSRRDFLKKLGISSGVGLFLGSNPLFAASTLHNLNLNSSERILVLIQLKGGNDGLNTFIPLYDYSTYKNNRPLLGINQSDLIKLNDKFAIPKYMKPLENLWQNGSMQVVNNVGYPNPNLSHFRSTDIWNSASNSDNLKTSGWLGNHLEIENPNYLLDPPQIPPAIQIGAAGSITFNGTDKNRTNYAVFVSSPEELKDIAENGKLHSLVNLPECYLGDQMEYLRTVANSNFTYADKIYGAYQNSTNNVEYKTNFGSQLAVAARLIKGGLGTKFYVVSIDGFDTHASQAESHAQLLSTLSSEVEKFYLDLKENDWSKKVLSMTYSEFGRRVEQNNSGGTDHGTSAPVMLFGDALEANGFVGKEASLSDLDQNGNLKHSIDFRQIYSTILKKWFCLDEDYIENILDGTFKILEDININCALPSNTKTQTSTNLKQHQARVIDRNNAIIWFNLTASAYVKLIILDRAGKMISLLYKGHLGRGEHKIKFTKKSNFTSSIHYIYTLEINGQLHSNQFILI